MIQMGVVVVVVAGAAFFGGMQYQKMSRSSISGSGLQGQGGRRGGLSAAAGGRVMGEVLNMDDSSLTIKTKDGSTKIVILSGSTTYEKTTTTQKSDLTVGTRIGIFGMTNSDGSVTARSVQLDPQIRVSPSGTPGSQR